MPVVSTLQHAYVLQPFYLKQSATFVQQSACRASGTQLPWRNACPRSFCRQSRNAWTGSSYCTVLVSSCLLLQFSFVCISLPSSCHINSPHLDPALISIRLGSLQLSSAPLPQLCGPSRLAPPKPPSEFPSQFPSMPLHCFELCFVRLHWRRKAPYANLVYIYCSIKYWGRHKPL